MQSLLTRFRSPSTSLIIPFTSRRIITSNPLKYPTSLSCIPSRSIHSSRPSQLSKSSVNSNKLTSSWHRFNHNRINYTNIKNHSQKRYFHSTNSNKDILFVTIPAIKGALLQLVRVTLIILPFAWRYRLFKKFPRATRGLWQLPLFAFFAVLALGLNQSPTTSRWRLLLMTEREELEWSNARFDELVQPGTASLVVSASDPRVQSIQRIASRLIKALEDEGRISCSIFPREDLVVRMRDADKRRAIEPSAQTDVEPIPFQPESSNPEKVMPSLAWNIFLLEQPSVNAFVLPSKDIFIYAGLLAVCEEDEDQLAVVIAHELAHVLERHATESLGFLALSGVFYDVLRGVGWALTLSFPMVGDALAATFNLLDTKLGRLAYSRKLESEADALGLELMARAGYDPRAALELWEIMAEVEEEVEANAGSPHSVIDHIALLRTHPPSEQRLRDISRILPPAIRIYESVKASQKHQAVVVAAPVVEESKIVESKVVESVLLVVAPGHEKSIENGKKIEVEKSV